MRPEHSTQRRPGRPGRAGGHYDRLRCHGWPRRGGRVERVARCCRCCRPAGDHQYERDGPRSKWTPRAWEADPSLTRSVLGAPSPSDPRSRSCCRLTREDYGYPCSIVEVGRRNSALPLRHAWIPLPGRDGEYRCCRCDWFDLPVRPSARMSRRRCLLTGHATHLHLQVDPLVPPAQPFPHHHWSSIAPTGRDDQAGENQQAWAEHMRARVRKVPVPRASPLALMPCPFRHQGCSSRLERPVMPECVQLAA
jgi:hypothetical protein